jgi:hypothetical protein
LGQISFGASSLALKVVGLRFGGKFQRQLIVIESCWTYSLGFSININTINRTETTISQE